MKKNQMVVEIPLKFSIYGHGNLLQEKYEDLKAQ